MLFALRFEVRADRRPPLFQSFVATVTNWKSIKPSTTRNPSGATILGGLIAGSFYALLLAIPFALAWFILVADAIC
jgi:hypothetical protein